MTHFWERREKAMRYLSEYKGRELNAFQLKVCNPFACRLKESCEPNVERFKKLTVFKVVGFSTCAESEHLIVEHSGRRYVVDNNDVFVVAEDYEISDSEFISQVEKERRRTIYVILVLFILCIVLTQIKAWVMR